MIMFVFCDPQVNFGCVARRETRNEQHSRTFKPGPVDTEIGIVKIIWQNFASPHEVLFLFGAFPED